MESSGWWLRTACDLLWPPQCCACGGSLGEKENLVCSRCEPVFPRISGTRCEVCSQPFPVSRSGLVCVNCQERHFHFVCSVSPLLATGPVREMVHRLKYNRERWLARPLGLWMAATADDERLTLSGIAGLVPVPLHPAREREREFNQADLLARELGRHWQMPVLPVLRRRFFTETQTHFDRRQRMQNLRDAFVLSQNASIANKKYLLVDDVFTTGSTLDECARVLLEGGAGAVWAVTAARA
jgi:competence protein ComFC